MTARGLARAPVVLHEHLSAIAPESGGDDMLLWMIGITVVVLVVLVLLAEVLVVTLWGLAVWARRRMRERGRIQ